MPGKKARVGAKIVFGEGILKGEIIDVLEDGNRMIKFEYDGIFEEVLDKLGEMPLPPYITHKLKDKNRYQTVYAKHDGSAAAPTAGLHFTNELLKELEDKGVKIARVLLHVGLGTFRPVKEENIDVVYVPGAFEIPLSAKYMAKSGKYSAVVALGAIIKGSTNHYDYVCAELSKGIASVSLESNTPVLFGVLTCDSIEQAIERAGSKSGNKGSDAAKAAIEMANLIKEIG